MNLNRFVQEHQPQWQETENLVKKGGRRVERLGSEGVLRLASLYRSISADLAIARRSFPGDPVVDRLTSLTTKARALVYERPSRRQGLPTFFADTYWLLLAARRGPLLISAALLLVPALLGYLWAVIDPTTTRQAVPDAFLWVTEQQSTDRALNVLGLADFSTYVMVNNIRVTLFVFALGITWGIGSGYVILQNGLILGLVAGLAVDAGNTSLLISAITAHGILELSCIVVGGAAGLSVGRAILRPGQDTRRRALTKEALISFQIAAGTAPWLVIAGLVEGFVSRTGLGPVPTVIVGVILGGLFWGLYVWRTRGVVLQPAPRLGLEVGTDATG